MPDIYEIDLVKVLDEIIAKKDARLALDTLRTVSETFSRYDEYLEKIGQLIV
jgi:hypothetical protein